MLEWLQVNAGWIALPLAVILAVIGWILGVRPATKRRAVLRQRQRGGKGSTNTQIGSASVDDRKDGNEHG